jgi:hypothetical protein
VNGEVAMNDRRVILSVLGPRGMPVLRREHGQRQHAERRERSRDRPKVGAPEHEGLSVVAPVAVKRRMSGGSSRSKSIVDGPHPKNNVCECIPIDTHHKGDYGCH